MNSTRDSATPPAFLDNRFALSFEVILGIHVFAGLDSGTSHFLRLRFPCSQLKRSALPLLLVGSIGLRIQ